MSEHTFHTAKERNLRVLFVHHGTVIGGAPVSLSLLVSQLMRDGGVDATIACHSAAMRAFFHRRVGVSTIEWPDPITQVGKLLIGWSSVHSIPLLRALLRSLRAIRPSIWAQTAMLQQLQPDIVHLNSAVLLTTALAARKAGIPVVWHVREAFHGIVLKQLRLLYGCLMRHLADAVVCISPVERRRMGGCRDTEVHVVYNPVDFNALDPARHAVDAAKTQYGLDANRPIVLSLGGVAPRKGAAELVDALRFVQKPVQLVFAGPALGPASNGQNVRPQLVCENLLVRARLKGAYSWHYNDRVATGFDRVQKLLATRNHTVHFVGNLEDIAPLLASCDVLVFAGTVPHFARPIYEAWAMKKPVVVFDIDGVTQNVEDGVDGVVVAPRTGEALGKAIEELLARPECMKEMGEVGYRKAVERCDPLHGAEKVMALYRKAIKERAR